MARKLALHTSVVLLVLTAMLVQPGRALVGNHGNGPPGRGVNALEDRIAELESEVAALDGRVGELESEIEGLASALESETETREAEIAVLQSQIDDILEGLPQPSGLTLEVSQPLLGPGQVGQASGTVIDQFGAPLPGAVVELAITDGTIPESVTTDASGTYVVGFTAPESFGTIATISASANGEVEETDVETSGEPDSIQFNASNCSVSECDVITVKVLDENGFPAIGAEVTLEESAGKREFIETTIGDGSVTIFLFTGDGLNIVDNTVTITVRQLGVEIKEVLSLSS